jgi:predicted DCC family thiol-disulfide oxidoreductase YuxK
MIIFYDGNCALCSTEMKQLKQADVENKIVLEDLNVADFSARYPEIDVAKAMTYLHAQKPSGEIIYGLDVTYQAWRIVGKHRWLKLIRLPLIRILADYGYFLFAKYRYPISRFLMPNTQCHNGQCHIKTNADQ